MALVTRALPSLPALTVEALQPLREVARLLDVYGPNHNMCGYCGIPTPEGVFICPTCADY